MRSRNPSRRNRLSLASFPPTNESAGLVMLGFIGTTELIIIAIIVLILFGSRLPTVMRSLGQGVVEFKKGVQGIEEEPEKSKETSQS
jgi:sec-independent protein translocase protein TatA